MPTASVRDCSIRPSRRPTQLTRLAATLLAATVLGSCAAGPHQLRRSVDDWDHKIYVNSPWLNAAMWVVPVYPVMLVGAMVGDFLVTDPYHFWLDDAWDGNGTGYVHLEVEHPDGWVDSLMMDRSGWQRVEK
ncbi:MAG: hypothetical protein AB8H80_11020 [Planctomycetota bacterium]